MQERSFIEGDEYEYIGTACITKDLIGAEMTQKVIPGTLDLNGKVDRKVILQKDRSRLL